MELYNNYSGLTDIELLNEIRVMSNNHEILKKEMIKILYIIEENEKIYNEKFKTLELIEKNYVELMKERTNRE